MAKKSMAKVLVWVLTLAMVGLCMMPAGFAFAEEGFGNTYYLATDGSDSNPGTIDAPFASINYAYSRLASGDTLVIREGTYKGFLQVIGKSDINIMSYEGEKVIIQNGSNFVGYVAYIGNSSNVTVSGITFTVDDEGVAGVLMYIDASHNVKITNCELFRGEGGIVPRSGTTGLEVSSCIMYDFTWPYGCILLYNTADSSLYNNIFYNSYFGVNTYGSGTTGNTVYNNTFYGNTVDIGGASVGGVPAGNVFRNNIFSSNIQNQNNDVPAAPIADFMLLNDFDYNFYNTDTMSDCVITNDGLTLQLMQAKGAEANGYTGSPKFLNPVTAEFQTGRGSDCAGKGDSQYLPDYDILGQPRAGNVSVGAYLCTDRTNYYVAANAADTNPGTDIAPFGTIAHALSVMLPGDYLFVKAGTYNEAVTISGKNNITVINYQEDQPVITQLITLENSQDVTVSGFVLNNSVSVKGGSNIKVSGMDINGGHIVIVPGTAATDGYEISSCLIHGFQGEGAVLVYSGKNGSISGNVIYNNSKQGILLEGGECTNNSLYNNTLHNNGSDICLVYAPSIGNPANNTFKNNIFGNGFEIGSDKYFTINTFDYNCYNKSNMSGAIGYANVYDEQGSYLDTIYPTLDDLKAGGQEQNGILGDPAFLNANNNDFRLRANSDCIGKGTSAGAPLYDIKGFKRTEPYDIGAYKYTGVVNEYYVAADGDDSNSGTADAPFKTIQHAVDLMAPGETVFVKGGTYNESVSVAGKKGDAADVFSIKAVPGEAPVLSSGGQLNSAISIDQGSDFWKIEGLEMQGYTGNGVEIKGGSENVVLSSLKISDTGEAGIYVENSDNTSLECIKVFNAQNGLAVSGSNGLTISRSWFDSAQEAAVSLNTCSSCKVTSSLFTNSNTGMSATGSNSLVVYNNDFCGNNLRDLELGQNSTANAVKNNIFGSVNSVYALEIADTGNDLDYNCYNKSTDAAAVNYTSDLTFEQFKALGKETNGIAADPMFTEPANGDFLLKAGSPCADMGIRDANTPAEGYDGASFEVPMDIGAVFSPFSLKVYYVATDGDDSNDGSIEYPWKTIYKGMSSLKASDTLYIRGGVYNERINLYDMNGRSYAYMTVRNYPGEEVVLDSQFSQNVGIKFSGCSYWKLEGLKFTNYVGAGVWLADGSEYITMENLEIWNISNPEFVTSGTEGILGDGGDYGTVRNCYIHDIGLERMSRSDHGIYVGYGAHDWVFDSNRIDNVPGAGIHFYGKPSGGDNCVAVNNVISNCRYGMILTMGTGNLVSNNTFYNNWEYDLYTDWWYNDSIIQNNILYNDLPVGKIVKVEDSANQTTMDYEINPVPIAVLYDQVSGNIFRNNIILNRNFGNRIVDINEIKPMDDYLASQALNTFEDNIEADPMFMDAANGDFTLQNGSPCINAGAADMAPTVDFTGTERVFEPDIGAYEYINIDIPYMQQLVSEYIQSGDLAGALAKQLENSLDQAQHQLDMGHKDQAVKHMKNFIKHLNNKALAKLVSEKAKNDMNAKAELVIEALKNS